MLPKNDTELEKALKILYDMEVNNHVMARGIEKLDHKISVLGQKRTFSKPIKLEASGDSKSTIIGAIIGAFLGVCIAVWCGIKFDLPGDSLEEVLGLLFVGGILGVIVGAIIGVIIDEMSRSSQNQEYEQAYQFQMREYNKKVATDEARLERELKIKESLLAEKNSLTARKKEAELKLKLFYDRVGIDESYRYLIPIGKIYEFSRLRFSDKLEGADGLYYMARRELREDVFRKDLNDKLDQVLDVNSKMYYELQGFNENCDRMIEATEQTARALAATNEKLGQIESNTAVAAYNSQRIAAEEDYQSFIMTWRG